MIRQLAAVVLIVVALGACGGSDSPAQASRLGVTSNPDVAALLGTPVDDDDVMAEFEVIHARSEELIALCMAEAGFDYVPVPFPAGAGEPVPQTETSLGVADQYFGAFSSDFVPEPEDPNEAILVSLSADEQAAYGEAMQGETPALDPRYETDDSIREAFDNQRGCRVDSQRAAVAATGRNQELIDDYSRLRAGLAQNDQNVIRARIEWARCMAEAGFAYQDEAAMRADLNGQAVAVLQDLLELRDQGVELIPQQDPPAEAAELIDAMRAQEAKVAAAHAVCREPITTAIAEVHAEADAIFLERNS